MFVFSEVFVSDLSLLWSVAPLPPPHLNSLIPSDVYLTQSITLAHHLQLSPAHFIIDGNDYDLQILRNTSLIVGSPLQYKHHMYTLFLYMRITSI